MVVAVLAVLKAGAAYLPLGPNYPAARLEFMIADSKAQLLITSSELELSLPVLEGVQVWNLEDPALSVEPLADAQPATRPRPENLAYTIYTSGSSGQPKGVAVSHASIAMKVTSMVGWLGIPHRARIAWSTEVTFDPSVTQLGLTFACGGTLVVVQSDVRNDPDRFEVFPAGRGNRCSEHRAGACFCFGAARKAFKAWVNAGWRGSFPDRPRPVDLKEYPQRPNYQSLWTD